MVFEQTRSPDIAKPLHEDTARVLVVPVRVRQNILSGQQSPCRLGDIDPYDRYGQNIGAPADVLPKDGKHNPFKGNRFRDIMPTCCGFSFRHQDLALIESAHIHGPRDYQLDLVDTHGLIRATPGKIFGIDLPQSTIDQTAEMIIAQAASNGCQSIAIGGTKDWGTGAIWLAAMKQGIIVEYKHDQKPVIDSRAGALWSLKASSVPGGRVIYDPDGSISLNQQASMAFGQFSYHQLALLTPKKKRALVGAAPARQQK